MTKMLVKWKKSIYQRCDPAVGAVESMARPLKAPDPSTSQVTIGLRVPAELKAELEEAAKEQDRNLSQEAERRLRRSFEPNDLLQDAVDGMLEQGGLLYQTEDTYAFLANAMGLLCGRDAAELAAGLAGVLGFINIREVHRKHGRGDLANVKITFPKANLDALKEAIRKVERECVITTEKE
jgi:hypothetical protein